MRAACELASTGVLSNEWHALARLVGGHGPWVPLDQRVKFPKDLSRFQKLQKFLQSDRYEMIIAIVLCILAES